ncbi:hypothetical protein CJ030_MR7G000027 [Morella rubra]|uniref:DCD domain-containing protein n=1 Tax=Morella rubra TaxID=262757 RepID=A0A6A1V3T5_9ROSI|nr:hypothetical protein CJ030_MR7G000027 [Morella rubra]
MFQHYSMFNSKEEALEHPYPEMNKEEWTRVCDLFASKNFRSAINKENRAKLKIVHTSGARSFQLTRKTHTNKDGMWTLEDARENFEKMEALQLQYESEEKSYTDLSFSTLLEMNIFSSSGFSTKSSQYLLSSGWQLPAQVQFNTIWHCDPLSETEFRHAIKTNYYEKHKFHFGLSKNQVFRSPCLQLKLFCVRIVRGYAYPFYSLIVWLHFGGRFRVFCCCLIQEKLDSQNL